MVIFLALLSFELVKKTMEKPWYTMVNLPCFPWFFTRMVKPWFFKENHGFIYIHAFTMVKPWFFHAFSSRGLWRLREN